MPSRITLRDIATQAKVHISTVSLALRNSPKLRPGMCDRIRKIADALGYTPDPGMAALVAYRKGVRAAPYQSTLAWLDNWPRHKGALKLRDITTFDDYYLGASGRAARFGYRTEYH
ncbi:MAG: LacI family DNA-binding transcriptional regulator [Opitutaceae bacterium]|jgi:LacI family transcriptional regulator|nr:LacI family DNA-binding transcriptional regulator [Opitutaceae bacterium]